MENIIDSLKQYKGIRYIEFSSALDFSLSWLQNLEFDYNSSRYQFKVAKINNDLYVYEEGKTCNKIIGNKIFKHIDFNYIFLNLKTKVLLTESNIFSVYKMGILI